MGAKQWGMTASGCSRSNVFNFHNRSRNWTGRQFSDVFFEKRTERTDAFKSDLITNFRYRAIRTLDISVFARSMRRSVRYWCGVLWYVFLNILRK